MTSADILGIEIGRRVARGVRLDRERGVVMAATEVPLGDLGLDRDGIIDPPIVCGAIEQILVELGIGDRSQIKAGVTVGPRNSGVGSGATMTSWLEAQAAHLHEALTCSGTLGVAFVPSRAVDAAVKVASGMGLDLTRVDLAPVAAARAIGDQVEDLICLGSGRGWQARMRDFEVLEAMESPEVGVEQPLTIVAPDGNTRFISGFGWVDLSDELKRSARYELGNLAPAVGVAIGVAYESPANLLEGKVVGCDRHRPKPAGPGDLARTTGPVGPGAQARSTGPVGPRDLARTTGPVAPGLRARTTGPIDPAARARSTGPVGPRDLARTTGPVGDLARRDRVDSAPTLRLAVTRPPEHRTQPVPAPQRPAASGPEPGRFFDPQGQPANPMLPPRPIASTERPLSEWDDDRVDASDPITMFSPENEPAHIMGKRNTRFGLPHLLVVLVLLAIALAIAYFVQ